MTDWEARQVRAKVLGRNNWPLSADAVGAGKLILILG